MPNTNKTIIAEHTTQSKMKSNLYYSKALIVALSFSSHASTARSFAPNPPMHHDNRIGMHNPRAFKRPYDNALLEPRKAPVIVSRTSNTSEKILSLRAGAGPSLLTILTSSLNTFFKQNPYAAAFLICK